ncbi:MAG TPA: DNA replication/repair protein RecF [Acidimicrobiales bacterium]|nr:DNA replication/repair protein RecF [Acidimicrobiales bacterium]
MFIERLSLTNFRNYPEVAFEPAPEGVTLLRGGNGAGKTNVLEAVNYVATLRSFRGAPSAALVRRGYEEAFLRAGAKRESRNMLVEIELRSAGRDRLKLNRRAVNRSEDIIGAVLATVFSPDDIEIVKGSPQARRDFLDDLLSSLHPKHAAARSELERVLKQRNALLRSAGGILRPGMAPTLDVWDAKLAAVGEEVAEARAGLVASLAVPAAAAYEILSHSGTGGGAPDIAVSYERSWDGPLLDALHRARNEELRRGVTAAGPQRDDFGLTLGGFAARTQASQGEQRSFALALRLASHALVSSQQGTSPVLLLDDIFSELDPRRCEALASCLPPGQALVTTAGDVPSQLPVAAVFLAGGGTVRAA